MISVREEPEGGGAAESSCREHIARAFAAGGWLQRALDLEHRPQQAAMAQSVVAAFLAEEALLVEAGTGVGKSMAYLLPGIMHATETKRPCVVSTHTISLQEQIQQKDLPQCRELFRAVPELESYAGFQSAVLVGKGNYVCRRRLSHALQSKADLFGGPEQDELLRIAQWADKSPTGLIQDLTPAPLPDVWDWVNADSSACSRRTCSADSCHYQAARARVAKAQVVIVNHSLLFALVNAGGVAVRGRGVLLPDDFLVLDEAHTMPDVATEHFGLHVSSYAVDRQLKMLFNERRRTGLLRKLGTARDQQRVLDALDASTAFFAFLRDKLLTPQAITRVREPDFCEPTILAPLRLVADSLEQIQSRLEDGPLRNDVKEQKSRVQSLHDRVRAFLVMAEEEHVHWVERSGRRGQVVALRTAPIDVAPQLREAIFHRRTAVVCTSATLAVAGAIEPFQKKAGAEEATTRVLASPFDFERNMRVYVASDLPQPGAGSTQLAIKELIDWVRFCVTRVRGGSLVLFTSHADLRRVAGELEPEFTAAGRPCYMQGGDLSRTAMATEFRAAQNGVLFGTDSFWTGVDVPGAALSQVIITRLPFDVPTHPIAEARAEWVRSQGGNPFAELNLPEALIKFRQGVGRLIRRQDDCGVVTILDSRILHKSYGRQFLESLPTSRLTRLNRGNRATEFRPLE